MCTVWNRAGGGVYDARPSDLGMRECPTQYNAAAAAALRAAATAIVVVVVISLALGGVTLPHRWDGLRAPQQFLLQLNL